LPKYPIIAGLAFIACIAGTQADAAPVVTAFATAPAPAGAGYCPAVPGGQASFLTTDSQVWSVFTYNGGTAGDAYAVQWVNPSGAVYLTNSFTQTITGGSSCYNYFIDIAGFPPATEPGLWRVNLVWNGAVISTLSFTISAPVICTSFSMASGSAQNPLVNGAAASIGWSFVASPSNCTWTAASSPGITLASPLSGVGSGTITAAYPANTTSVIQVLTVTVTSGSNSFTLYVTQNPVSCTFTSFPTGFIGVSGLGATLSLAVTATPSTCGWFLTTTQTWLHPPSSYQVGSQTLAIVVDANNTGVARFGPVTTYGAVSNISISVSQLVSPPPTLQLSSSSASGSGFVGNTFTLTPSISITSSNSTPISFNVSTSSSNSTGGNWISVNIGSGTTGTSPTLTIQANMQGFAPGSYSGTVTITPTSPAGVAPQTIAVGATASGSDSLQETFNPAVGQNLQLTYPSATTGSIQVTSSSAGLTGLYFTAVPTILTPAGGSWLTITQNASQTNGTIKIAGTRGSLAAGTYNGRVDFYDTNNNVTSVTVVFVVAAAPSLSAV